MKKISAPSLGILFLALFSLFFAACSRSSRLYPAQEMLSTGWHEFDLQVGDQTRWFRVYVPRVLPTNSSVVFILHGPGQSMRKLFASNAGGSLGWIDKAEKEGLLLVAPNGVNPDTNDAKGDNQDWDDLRTDAVTKHSTAEDVTFIRSLFDWVQSKYPVNSKKFYLAGISTGGIMVYRIILELPGRFAAAASFIANLPDPTASPVNYIIKTPILIANGVKDPLMKWDGGRDIDIGMMMSTQATLDWWISSNQASSARPISSVLPDLAPDDDCLITRTFYPARPGGAPVLFYKIDGGGHTIPTRKYPLSDSHFMETIFGPVCQDAEGADLAWDFLSNPTQP